MTSVNFDRAAGFYDRTRLLGPGWASHGLPALLAAAGPAGRLLEVGVGTGRIAGPLWAQGARLVGCDLAQAMLSQLRAKHPQAPIIRGDAVRLPLASGQFNLVYTVHVLHLIAGWPQALAEFRRVLAPGGLYATTWHERNPAAASRRLRAFWQARVEAHGGAWQRPGIEAPEALAPVLEALGGRLAQTVDLPAEPETFRPRELLDNIAGRVYSDAWQVSDEVLAASLREATEFARAEFGDLEAELVQPAGRSWLEFYVFG